MCSVTKRLNCIHYSVTQNDNDNINYELNIIMKMI